jgi:hypothetical protein
VRSQDKPLNPKLERQIGEHRITAHLRRCP